MPSYRAMVVFENQTALPEDRFVNTWHFSSTAAKAEAASAILGQLENFYNAGGPNGIAAFLSGKIDRGSLKSQVRVYDLADAEPREPEVKTWTLGAPASETDLPNEVAACLSFYATRNIPRQRGRIFLGPLKNNAVGSGTGDQRLHGSFTSAVITAVEHLDNAGPTAVWCVRSTMDNVLRPVTKGWVDNAFDTVRKRGKKPDNRTVFDLGTVVG